MATKVKPSRLNITGTPQAGQVPMYVDSNNFQWGSAGSSGYGRFLSLRDCVTGQPISFPESTPYTYNTGDYFMVSVVSTATPPVNYKPNGSSYTGTASSTTESDEVLVGDVYVYDGSVWLLQSNNEKTVAFANIAGQPTDNVNLASALSGKLDTSALSDTNYGGAWSGDTTHAATKNAIYTKIHTMDVEIGNKAADNTVVKLSGNQTINGTKTFGTSPVVPSKTSDATNTGTAIATEAQVYKKQDTLVSGTNIKTINSNSILGSGDLSLNEVPSGGTDGQVLSKVSGSVAWANPTGGAEIVYATQAEYTALLPGAASDGKHYFIFDAVAVTGVTLDESSIVLTTPGDTYQLTATVSPNDAYDKSVNWSSSDDTIATVSQTGLVTCVTPGTCTITVTTTDGGFTATCGVDAGGWQPGANTVLYMPLKGDILDKTGNYTFTNTNVTVGSDFATFSGNGFLLSSSNFGITGSSSRTIVSWVKPNSTNLMIGIGWGADGLGQKFGYYLSDYEIVLWGYGVGGDLPTNQSLSSNTWALLSITYDGSSVIIYKNGVQVFSGTRSLNTGNGRIVLGKNNTADEYYFTGSMGEQIVENKIWTASDVLNYYNSTKGDYGIS